jgi:hypothetical protein
MSKTTMLAVRQVTQSRHNTIIVELVAHDDMPPMVRIAWPLQPTVTDPRRFPEVAAQLAKLFAEAATAMAQIRARRRL